MAPWMEARTLSSAAASAGAMTGTFRAVHQLCSPSGSRLTRAADERPAVAHYHSLSDQPVLADLFLERARGDILAARRDQQVLLAAGDGQEAVRVEGAEVAGPEETVHKRLRVGGLVGVVALEHADALDQDLAVLGHPDGGSRNAGCPTVPTLVRAGVLAVHGAVVSVSP